MTLSTKGDYMETDDRVRADLQAHLDSHGYGFQYAVLAAAKRLCEQGRSSWRLPLPEVPVSAGGRDTRVDFVMQHCHTPMFLIGECKRSNPALSDWCFLRAPEWTGNRYSKALFCETVYAAERDNAPQCAVSWVCASDSVYHLGLELKTNEKGPSNGTGRGTIEDAATQVLRGMNGFAEMLARSGLAAMRQKSATLLPVIFTTARLCVCQADLAAADILTGKLSLPEHSVSEVEWLVYHYHQSPGLTHSLRVIPTDADPNPLTDLLITEAVRPICIVSAKGIDGFLADASLRALPVMPR